MKAAETYNCITAKERATCIIPAERSTNKTLIIPMKPQDRIIATGCITCTIAEESASCRVPSAELTTETFTCRNGAGQRLF